MKIGIATYILLYYLLVLTDIENYCQDEPLLAVNINRKDFSISVSHRELNNYNISLHCIMGYGAGPAGDPGVVCSVGNATVGKWRVFGECCGNIELNIVTIFSNILIKFPETDL